MNGGKTWGEMLAEIEALRAENERLRKALGEIQKMLPHGRVGAIASAALALP
jgi:regulator of replication initiation timing